MKKKIYFMDFVSECLKALACYTIIGNLLWLLDRIADWSCHIGRFSAWPILGHLSIFLIASAVLLGGIALSNVTKRWRKEDMKKM